MARAEQCFRKAVEISPPLCQRELGNFLFRQMRYPEAAEAFQQAYPAMLSGDAVLNYGEVLFFQKNEEGLKKLEKDVSRGVGDSLPVRAYVQCLLAAMDRKTEDMVKNYQVAGLRRETPMGLLITFLVSVETVDIPQMVPVLLRWKGTAIFEQKKEEILTSVRHVLMQAMEKRKWQEASRLAMLFRDQKPPEILVYKALLFERAAFGVVPEDLLQEAITYFPEDQAFRALSLRSALSKGNVDEVNAAYEQVIAKSADPELDRYRKAIFLEQKGLVEEAFAEISKNLQEHPSEREAKHCLAFAMRTGHKPALEAVASYPQLAAIARFENERRYGDPEAALKMLTEQPLEQGLSAEVLEEREILLPLGLYLGISRQRERAIAVYETLKPYMMSSPIIDLNLSEIYKSLDDKEKALANAADAYAKAPNNPLVRSVYGMRCAENDDFEKAVTLIPINVQEPEYQKVLVTSLEKCIEISYKDQRLASCRSYIRSLQELQPENACVADYLKRLEEGDEKNNGQ